jgi:hypothetical protein
MVLYEMFSEKVPFEEMDDDQVKIEDFIIPINFNPKTHLQIYLFI